MNTAEKTRVARAMVDRANTGMLASIGPGPGTNLTLETMTPQGREHYLELAAAAIEAMDAERQRAGAYLVGRLHDVLRDVDPEYVGSPLEQDEVRPFLGEGES